MRQKKVKLIKKSVEKFLNKSVKSKDDQQKLPDGSIQYIARSTFRKAKKEYNKLNHLEKQDHEKKFVENTE